MNGIVQPLTIRKGRRVLERQVNDQILRIGGYCRMVCWRFRRSVNGVTGGEYVSGGIAESIGAIGGLFGNVIGMYVTLSCLDGGIFHVLH